MANGIEEKFTLRAKKDKALTKSIITKEKADFIEGSIVELRAPLEVKDSAGTRYQTRSTITLQCEYGGSLETFGETFYIVQNCECDTLLRRNISGAQFKDEANCLPLMWKDKTQGM